MDNKNNRDDEQDEEKAMNVIDERRVRVSKADTSCQRPRRGHDEHGIASCPRPTQPLPNPAGVGVGALQASFVRPTGV
jgi:hypothetical protein